MQQEQHFDYLYTIISDSFLNELTKIKFPAAARISEPSRLKMRSCILTYKAKCNVTREKPPTYKIHFDAYEFEWLPRDHLKWREALPSTRLMAALLMTPEKEIANVCVSTKEQR